MKPLLSFNVEEEIGEVISVDTGMAIANVISDEILSKLQVNQLLAIKSPHSGRHIIGMIIKIFRKAALESLGMDDDEYIPISNLNQIRVVFIGEFIDNDGTKQNVFKRNVSAVPSINAGCYKLDGDILSNLMKSISSNSINITHPLKLGKYAMDDMSEAYLDGDKLFQRHAAIVGSTGSGKSFCVAKIVEQMADLNNADAILFDIHGEYSAESFKKRGIMQYKIATPGDLATKEKLSKGILMIPYWLLNYEEMQALLLDRSDQNAPNQAMLLSKEIIGAKNVTVNGTIFEEEITVDSPIPYNLKSVLESLKNKDTEMVPGAKSGTEKQGPYNGKLTRFNQRLQNKLDDKRMGFMFSLSDEELNVSWLESFCQAIMGINEDDGKVKVIDFSEVPSDVLPLVTGLIARIVFSVQQWSNTGKRHPIAFMCDEAHLYVQQQENKDAIADIGIKAFERIAKEGRKYGLGLVIISQRPSEVNRTVLSQCNNFISLRLTNIEDQNVIKRLLPDNLGNIADNLSLLDIGEAIVVGDSILLPSKIKVDLPSIEPTSNTVKFWELWSSDVPSQDIKNAISNMISQSKKYAE